MAWSLASIVLLLVSLAIFIWTGIRGVDYGVHWDEAGWQIEPVKTMVKTGILLPPRYIYPSFNCWLNLGAAIPDILQAIQEAKTISPGPEHTRGMGKRQHVKAKTLAALDQPAYLLRARAIYVVITALAVLWVYLTVLVWGGPPMQAAFAAALLGTSWEIGYHSRWVTCDCILLQFAALTTLFNSLAVHRRNSEKWLVGAAITAGLGAGTKYPGGALLLPVLLAAYAVRGRLPAGERTIARIAKILVSFAVAFVVSTPGAVIQPIRFLLDVREIFKHYRSEEHGNYTVSPGLGHGLGILEYMGMVVFSPYTVFAAFFFLLAILGAYAIMRRSGLTALIVIAFPIISLGVMSAQRVMIVRNDLAAVPDLAVLSSFGLVWLYDRLKETPLRFGLVFVTLAGLLMNEAWLIWSSQTIVDRQAARFARQAADHVRSNPDTKFYLSPKVRSLLEPHRAVDLPNVVTDPARSTVALICASEKSDPYMKAKGPGWPCNYRGLSLGWFGPYEVNWDYYPTWMGDDRIVILDSARALELDVIPGQPNPSVSGAPAL